MDLEALAELNRRGLLTPDQQGALAELQRRQAEAETPPLPTKREFTALETGRDVAEQSVYGFGRDFANLLSLPARGIDLALEAVGQEPIFKPDESPTYKPFLNPPAPRTKAGRYAREVGGAVGLAALPQAGALRLSQQMVPKVGPAATATRQILRDAGQAMAKRPGAATALDLASAGTAGAAAEAARRSESVPEWLRPTAETAAGIVGGMAPGIAASFTSLNRLLTPQQRQRIGTVTGENIATRRAREAQEDAAALARQDVREFGPAFNQPAARSVGTQLTETPLVGAPLRNNLDETYMDAARASRRIAGDISPEADLETAGAALQRGLDRFRTRSFASLDPEVLRQRSVNIDPNSPLPNAEIGGAQQMRRIAEGRGDVNNVTGGTVQNLRGRDVALPRTRAQTMQRRTRVEDLTDQELNRFIRQPADRTSFASRAEALYEKAYRGVPALMRRDGSRNPNLLPSQNSRQIVRNIIDDEARTGIRAGVQSRYGDMFERLGNARSNITLDDLRAMRTAIGRDLGNFGTYDASLDRTQLKQLYSAISSDIEIGMQDIATRAAQQAVSRARGNTGVTRQTAQRAQQAIRDMRLADRYYRQGIERMDRFLRIVRNQNPQSAAAGMIRAASSGRTGNMRMYRTAMSVLRPEERAQFASLVVREMGQPTPGAGGIVAESGFSPSRFETSYNAMGPAARRVIFSREQEQALEDLFRVARSLSRVEDVANRSRSATNLTNLSLFTGAGGAAALGVDAALSFGSAAATGFVLSTMMSRPAYTRWMIRYMQLRAAVRRGSDRSIAPMLRHVAGLERRAMDNPALWPVYAEIVADAMKEAGANPDDQ